MVEEVLMFEKNTNHDEFVLSECVTADMALNLFQSGFFNMDDLNAYSKLVEICARTHWWANADYLIENRVTDTHDFKKYKSNPDHVKHGKIIRNRIKHAWTQRRSKTVEKFHNPAVTNRFVLGEPLDEAAFRIDPEMTLLNPGMQLDHIVPIWWAENDYEMFVMNMPFNLRPLGMNTNKTKGNFVYNNDFSFEMITNRFKRGGWDPIFILFLYLINCRVTRNHPEKIIQMDANGKPVYPSHNKTFVDFESMEWRQLKNGNWTDGDGTIFTLDDGETWNFVFNHDDTSHYGDGGYTLEDAFIACQEEYMNCY